MNFGLWFITFTAILFIQYAHAATSSPKTVYCSLDSRSILQLLSFYELYPETKEGQEALSRAWQLLSGNRDVEADFKNVSLPTHGIEAIIALVNKGANEEVPILSDENLKVIEKLGSRLKNRSLKGSAARSEQEVIALPESEIDLARGLFLSQMGQDEASFRKIQSYEAMIDLMALQILGKITLNDPPEAKLQAINDFIFDDMGFCFPPHSLYVKDIDVYTFLSSVIDSRKGVCLGVSILYLSIAQRLGLKLEVITPPGHIYIRYRNGTKEINIETTARGIHIDSENYLSVETRKLQQRTIKEVIGMAHMNQASIYWHTQDYEKALQTYDVAKKYLPNDMLLNELMAYNMLFVGRKEEGEKLLKEVIDHLPDHAVCKDSTLEDYFQGFATIDDIKVIFKDVEEDRASVLEKRQALEEVLMHSPKFRSCLMQLATTWLQLHRPSDALEVLKRYHRIDPNNPTVEYYLSVLSALRFEYDEAWRYLKNAERITAERQHYPKALKEIRRELAFQSPEP